jgi:LytS/YehU family sensor histidine kinase
MTEGPSYKPTALLPFVENAFKHGISETRFKTLANMRLKVDKGKLQLKLRIQRADLVDEGKIRLPITQRQLELTYSDFKLDVKDLKKVHLKCDWR